MIQEHDTVAMERDPIPSRLIPARTHARAGILSGGGINEG